MTEYGTRLANSQDSLIRMRATDAAVRLGTTAVRARAGLRRDGGGVVTAVAGTMNVQVSAFSCWLDTGSVGQVGFTYVLDALATLAVAAGHATLARVDTVAVVADAATPTVATVQVVSGIPGAGAPVLPAYAVPLRDINVPAGLSAGTGGLTAGNLSTDRRVYSVATGGVLPVASQTERDALSPQPGQAVFRVDTGKIEVKKVAAGWDTYGPEVKTITCLLEQTAIQTLATGTLADITFAEVEDTDLMFNAGVSTTTVTINTAGLYLVNTRVSFAANGTGKRALYILKNGSVLVEAFEPIVDATTITAVELTKTVRFAAGDTVKLQGLQNSGANLNTNIAAAMPSYLELVRVGS